MHDPAHDYQRLGQIIKMMGFGVTKSEIGGLWVTNQKLGVFGGGYYFLPNGGPWKSCGSQNFFMRNRGSQKNQQIFGWLPILMKILNEIAPKMHIFCSTCIGGYMFLQHCSSRGGINFLIIKWGGSQKYCQSTFGNLWPPIPKKMVAPLSDRRWGSMHGWQRI